MLHERQTSKARQHLSLILHLFGQSKTGDSWLFGKTTVYCLFSMNKPKRHSTCVGTEPSRQRAKQERCGLI